MSSQFDSEENGIAAAVAAGMALGKPEMVTGQLATVLVPSGARLEQIDLQALEDKYADNPRRKTGARSFATAQSFIDYVNAHKLVSTAIYANKLNTKFEAVFNDHEPEPRVPAHGPEPVSANGESPQRAEPQPAAESGTTEDMSGLGEVHVHVFDMSFGRDDALHSAVSGDTDKARHHCISSAAALYNWHSAISGRDVRMCPGSSDVAKIVDGAFPGEIA